MWSEGNTEGFDAAELARIEAVIERLERAAGGSIEPQNLNDVVNNEWIEGIPADVLYARAAARLGIE